MVASGMAYYGAVSASKMDKRESVSVFDGQAVHCHMTSRLFASEPVQDGVQPLKWCGIKIETRGTSRGTGMIGTRSPSTNAITPHNI